MTGIIVIFFLDKNNLSLHMVHISEHINSSNHKIHSHGQISKMIVNLISKKCKNKNNSTCQLRCLNNSLLIIIVNTPEIIYGMLIKNHTWEKYIHIQ